MKSLGIIAVLLFVLTVGIAYGYELTRSEITVTDVWLDPAHPQAGDSVSINASVYNGGTVDTKYFASVVTVAYFVDGELRKITDLGNVKPGFDNAVKISSGKFWPAEYGKHNMTVVIDYHNTLPDSIDDPSNNKLEKTFLLEPPRKAKIAIGVSPQYLIPKKDTTLTINGTLVDSDTGKPLTNQPIQLNAMGNIDALVTDKAGKFKITKALVLPQGITSVSASFAGAFPYAPTNSSNFVFNLKSKENAAIVLKTEDPAGNYDYSSAPTTIVVYQDSYDKTYKKLTADKHILVDNMTAWVPIDASHSYLEEVYFGGRYFFSSDWTKANPSQVISQKFVFPDLAQIRFKITGTDPTQIQGLLVKNWIYSGAVDSDGYTDWMNMLPTRSKNEPYVATITTQNGQEFDSEPFFVDSGEKKVIEIDMKNQVLIPKWLKANASWWAHGKITDSDFTKGIGYLVSKKIIMAKASQSSSNEKTISSWVKSNAGLWSEGKISDDEFLKGIQYLIKNGMIAA